LRSELFYQEMPLGPDFEDRLREAEANNRIVILLVDPWTILLDAYNIFMKIFNKYRYVNSGILVVWDQEPETTGGGPALEQAVTGTFPIQSAVPNRRFFPAIRTPGQLLQALDAVLNEIRAELLEAGKIVRKAEVSVPMPSIGPAGGGRPR
jgi:hypothetical protein